MCTKFEKKIFNLFLSYRVHKEISTTAAAARRTWIQYIPDFRLGI